MILINLIWSRLLQRLINILWTNLKRSIYFTFFLRVSFINNRIPLFKFRTWFRIKSFGMFIHNLFSNFHSILISYMGCIFFFLIFINDKSISRHAVDIFFKIWIAFIGNDCFMELFKGFIFKLFEFLHQYFLKVVELLIAFQLIYI